jgi:hypothetical protein
MPEAIAEKPKDKIGVGIDRKICERRVKGMQEEFNTWEPTMKDIKAYINPVRGFFNDLPNQGQAIDHKTQLDGHPRRAARTLGGGMTSGMTSPARPWFKLGLDNPVLMEIDNVKDWLDIVQERMSNVFSRSNIYTALTNVYEEDGSFGTAAMLLTSDPSTVIRARNYTIGEYWLSIGADGRINGFARRYWLQVSALVKEFGEENVSEPVKSAYGRLGQPGNVDKWVSVIQLIEENDQRIDGSKHFKDMAYRSLQWEESSPKDLFLRVGGYNKFPVLAPRWQNVTTSDIWGKGAPGWDALGDSRMLMKLQKKKMLGLDKTTNPPVSKDAMVGEVNTLPGGETVTSSNAPDGGLRPVYQIKFDLASCQAAIKETQQAISETFYTDLFMMLMNTDRTNITAREIAELHETKLLMLGPVLECLESELLDPLIELTYEIMWEAGLIPEPPPEMQGQEVKVEYISILAQAQKMVGTTAIEQVCNFVGNLVKIWPEAKDKLDVDQAVDIYADLVGIPVRIIRGDEAVAKIRQAAQEALLKQQQMQAGMVAADGAKTLSQAKLGEDSKGQNSALDAVMAALTGKAMPKNPIREKTGVA